MIFRAEAFIANGADINEQDKCGRKTIMEAARGGFENSMISLIDSRS